MPEPLFHKDEETKSAEKKEQAAVTAVSPEGADIKKDISGHFEFGGTPGVTAMMIGFPTLMWYMWIGATYYDGKFPTPAQGESMGEFFSKMVHYIQIVSLPTRCKHTLMLTVLRALSQLYKPGRYTGVSSYGKQPCM